MGLVTPSIGLVFWMLVTFSIVLVILKKFAWKPILDSIREREQTIEDEMKDKIVGDAKVTADEEAKKIMQRAQDEIEKQKSAAIAELRKEVSILSVQIAEKLVQQKLETSDAQQALIAQQLNQLN